MQKRGMFVIRLVASLTFNTIFKALLKEEGALKGKHNE